MTAILNAILSPLRYLTVALLLALVAVPAVQIVLRLVGAPLVGAEELTRFLLICLVFLGYPLVVLAGDNIVLAELRLALPRRIELALGRLIALAGVAAAGIICFATATTIAKNLGNATPTLAIPFWLFLGATFVAFLGAAVVHVRDLVRGDAPSQTVTL